MFVLIQNDIINVNHVVNCTPVSGVIQVSLVTGKRYTVPAAEFEANVMPFLPMLKAQTVEMVVLPPEEVQVQPAVVEPAIPDEPTQEASVKTVTPSPKKVEVPKPPRSKKTV